MTGTIGTPGTTGRTLPRRTILTGMGVAVGGAIGSGVTLAAASPSGPDAGAATPGEDLMAEHGVLTRILLVYRELSRQAYGDGAVPPRTLHGAATIIHDYIEGFHEALEETYVFPALLRAGSELPTVEVLLQQHATGRLITQDLLALPMSSSLTSAQRRYVAARLDAFVRMYEPHEAREDTVIFPAYRAITGEAELARLGERFNDLQRQQFGPRGFADVVDQVASLERALGIHDLAQFTATLT